MSWTQSCIQPSSTLPSFASIQNNVPVASPSIISCGIVPFSRKRNLKRRRADHRGPRPTAHPAFDPLKLQKWFTAAGQEGCNLYQRKWCNLGEACKRAHVCKPVPRPPAHVLPEIKSPFNLRECLRTHPDADFATALLHYIEFGVRIGYQPVTRAFQTYDNN